MRVDDLYQMPEFQLVTKGVKGDKEITGGYCGDLLSWVMAHAQKGNLWITVQTHVNIVAIAALLELSCIIVPEDITIEEETIEKSIEEDIAILKSHLNSFEVAKILSERGI